MRHGEAEGVTGHSFKSDNERKLTERGQLEAQLMANWLLNKNINFSHVFISPFVRAQQTCAQLLKVLNFDAITLDFITPSGDAKQVHDYIDGLISSSQNEQKQELTTSTEKKVDISILIVSHMPLVSYLVSEFTYDDQAPIFATAAIAQIKYDVSTMGGELVSMLSPDDLC
jgi:phosphohistidine phosphatase